MVMTVNSLSLPSVVMINTFVEGDAKQATYGGGMRSSCPLLGGPSPRVAANGVCVSCGGGLGRGPGWYLHSSGLAPDHSAVVRLLCP